MNALHLDFFQEARLVPVNKFHKPEPILLPLFLPQGPRRVGIHRPQSLLNCHGSRHKRLPVWTRVLWVR